MRDGNTVVKEINASIKSCIAAHGPITHEWVGSASKRILAALKVLRRRHQSLGHDKSDELMHRYEMWGRKKTMTQTDKQNG